MQEGLFLYTNNVSPYDGGVYHQAPLLLPLFSLLPDLKTWPIFNYILYTVVDLLSANALCNIANSGEAGNSKLFKSPRRDKRWSGVAIAAGYVCRPKEMHATGCRANDIKGSYSTLIPLRHVSGDRLVSSPLARFFMPLSKPSRGLPSMPWSPSPSPRIYPCTPSSSSRHWSYSPTIASLRSEGLSQ